jgi:hypothetical protein
MVTQVRDLTAGSPWGMLTNTSSTVSQTCNVRNNRLQCSVAVSNNHTVKDSGLPGRGAVSLGQ